MVCIVFPYPHTESSPNEATRSTNRTARSKGPPTPPTPIDAHHVSQGPGSPTSAPLSSPAPLPTPTFIWGEYDSVTFSESLEDAYHKVVHWRKNTFRVPYGRAGKEFVIEMSRLYRAYADCSALEAIALKAATVMSVLLLQRPFRSSKPRDHSACLERRMSIWKKGDIKSLLTEGLSLQKRLPKLSTPSNESNLARTFSRLMFQGKTNAALQLLSQHGKGGILRAEEMINAGDGSQKRVLDILRSKHPPAQPISQDALLLTNTDPPEIPPVRDTVGGWLSEVCNDVCIEPSLQRLTGETLRGATANTGDAARLDVAANDFWGCRYERTYIDVRVFNPHAPSNRQQSLSATYKKHERIKIRAYE